MHDFHPRLFGFAGHSGSGKTTLIEKLITQLKHFNIGYIKHDAHHFEIDHPGKDTFRQYEAGAQMVFINDSVHSACRIRGGDLSLAKDNFRGCEFVFVEGHKHSTHPKFLFLDSKIEEEFLNGNFTNVLATVSTDGHGIEGLPAFHRDDVSAIATFILDHIQKSLDHIELCGLVLNNRKDSQVINILKELGIRTFLSSDIKDRFLDFGPLGSILSAMTTFPCKAWFVISCDLPDVTRESICELLYAREPLKLGTFYYHKALFGIYEPGIYPRLLQLLGQNNPMESLFYNSQSLKFCDCSIIERSPMPLV